MKKVRFLGIIILAMINFSLYSQDENAGTDTNEEKKQSQRKDIDGFQGIKWATKYTDVKEEFRTLSSSPDVKYPVEIVRDIPDKEILIKRNGIFYRYVFYKKPNNEEGKSDKPDENRNNTENENENQEKNEEDTPRFFFMESSFPFVPAENIYKKLSNEYGEKTSSAVNKDESGAYVWETEKGYIVQWLEPYNKAPYTRSLYYISKDIRKKIEEDLGEYQNYRELKAVKNLLP